LTAPTHILVIRLSALGDVAMTVPVLRVVAQTYPDLKITIVSKGFYQPLFQDIHNINFLEADVYGQHRGIDAVADLHNVIRSKIITNYLGWQGVRTSTIDKGRTEKKALTRSNKKEFKFLKTTHQRYADVFAVLGLPIDLNSHHFPGKRDLSPKLNTLIGVEPKKLIGIAPFAAYKSKMYPLDFMKEVIAHLDGLKKYRLFLFGGGDYETATLTKIADQFDSATVVAGVLYFEEELALISNLDLMLSMDSGNGHLAALFGIPTITLWGVTHPAAGFAPFQQPKENQLYADREKYPLIPTSVYGNKCPEGYEAAMKTITPEAVLAKILKNL